MKFFLVACLWLVGSSSHAQSFTAQQYRQDFDYFWTTMSEQYAYFDQKQVDWNQVRAIYSPRVDTVSSRRSLINLLETTLYEVYDHHCSLQSSTAQSRRLVPTSTDVWADYQQNKPVITEVRRQFGAEKAGVIAGMEVIAINGVPVELAIQPFLSHSIAAAAKGFALRLCLAGNHITPRRFTLKSGTLIKDYFPDQHGMSLEHIGYSQQVESRLYGQTGYLRINNCLGDNSLIARFDSVLNQLMQTRSLIVDMRETPSGGNTTVARAILGRFIDREYFYQKHEYFAEEKKTGIKRSWQEIVSPRGVPYTKPLVILCDHWTGSVGEGITIGFDGMNRATVIGTSMAGLNGAIYSYQLPNTKIGFGLPSERLYHIQGRPREDFKPLIQVDMTKKKPGSDEDILLNRALQYLASKLGSVSSKGYLQSKTSAYP